MGLGDVDIGVRVFLWDATSIQAQRRQNLALTAGTSFPTGSDDRDDAPTASASISTRSSGPAPGAPTSVRSTPSTRTPGTSFSPSPAGSGPPTATSTDYGDAVLWSAQLRFRVVEPFALPVGVDGRYAWRDRSAGVLQENTGGLVVSAVPGLAWNVGGPIWLLAQVQVPLRHRTSSASRR